MRLNIISILLLHIIAVNRSLVVLPPQYVCTADVFECPDGSYVSRNPNNNCRFSQCTAVPIQRICASGQCVNPSGVCQGSVLCFANPCQVTSCAAAASCQANYCGGCHAVFKDANGVVINPENCAISTARAVNTVGCGINHCSSYNDGCNICSCNENGIALCPMRPCLVGQQTISFCTACEPGYILNRSTNECEGCMCTMQYSPVCCSNGNTYGHTYGNQCQANCQQASGCNTGACNAAIAASAASAKVPPIISTCGGFDNCATYYDGCNNCFCGEYGVGCTRRYCMTKEPSKCKSCKIGYTLVENQCVQTGVTIL